MAAATLDNDDDDDDDAVDGVAGAPDTAGVWRAPGPCGGSAAGRGVARTLPGAAAAASAA